MTRPKKRSNYRPPGRPQVEDVGTDDPRLETVVLIADQHRQSALDGLERVSRSGRARYIAGAEALDRLAELESARRELDREISHAVAQARRCRVTWSEIGEALGVSQQAVSKRYGQKVG